MSGVLRFVFYFIVFLILFRLVRSALSYLFGSKSNQKINVQSPKKKSKFENVEDAKYIEIKPEDEKKN
ncbi:MAG: hypothetical protein WAU11_03265 [Ignavibacteriaceae bacterium]